MALELQLDRLGSDRCLVTFADPEREVNTLDEAALTAFEGALSELEADAALRLVVLVSGKEDCFLAGADLRWLLELETSNRAQELVDRGQRLLDRWRRLSATTIAAIRGSALGGGLELALACDRRIAAADPATRLGLPEVRLGLIPALGGTFELPRRVGLEQALRLLLSGRSWTARQALSHGLVERVVKPEELLEAAAEAVASDSTRRPANLRRWLLAGNPLGRGILLRHTERSIVRRTHGHYPAPLHIVRAVRIGLARGRRAALAAERRSFGELALSPASRNLVRLFLASRRLSRVVTGVAETTAVGIVGAGFMGSGIAAAGAGRGLRVRVVDPDEAARERALRFCQRRLADLERRGVLSTEQAREAAARVGFSATLDGLESVDLVIEAVFEDQAVKQAVFAELERRLPPATVIGSNTSTIPITRLGRGLAHAERLVGIHFFSPVHRMPLVEIIRHPNSSESAIERALDLAARLEKVPIVVRDGPGFYTSRILAPYLTQAVAMLTEGLAIEAIDAAARGGGFPVGPLELLDEVGIDIATHAARTMSDAFPDRMPHPEKLERLVASGRLGRKSGLGFYRYGGRKKRPDRAVSRLLDADSRRSAPADHRVPRRLLLAMSLEAVRCLESGVIADPTDGDVGAVLGVGFPPFLGGPFRYLDAVGLHQAASWAEELAPRLGPAFEPPALLRQNVLQGGTFHR